MVSAEKNCDEYKSGRRSRESSPNGLSDDGSAADDIDTEHDGKYCCFQRIVLLMKLC